MKLSPSHLRSIEAAVPKREQQAFLDQAIEKALVERANHSPPVLALGLSTKKLENPLLEVFVDGGSRGNPGPSGGGYAVYQKGVLIMEGAEYFGEKTNNQAEYLALRAALRRIHAEQGDVPLKCFMDSKLVVEQVSGRYKVKSPNMKPLHEELGRILNQFSTFEIHHIPREQNGVADRLANRAMDRHR